LFFPKHGLYPIHRTFARGEMQSAIVQPQTSLLCLTPKNRPFRPKMPRPYREQRSGRNPASHRHHLSATNATCFCRVPSRLCDGWNQSVTPSLIAGFAIISSSSFPTALSPDASSPLSAPPSCPTYPVSFRFQSLFVMRDAPLLGPT